MLCRKCNVEKLSEEFTWKTISTQCDHAALLCLRCAVAAAKKDARCPYPGCLISTSGQEKVVKQFEEKLKRLFPEDDAIVSSAPVAGVSGGHISILLMTGESIQLHYHPNLTIIELKKMISANLNVPPAKQKLIYRDKELQEYHDSAVANLATYGVVPNSSIHLLIVLYTVPKSFNHVVFDLYWGYPSRGRDYLDASCLLFSGKKFIEEVDYNHEHELVLNCVRHSGDVMNDAARQGHHTIELFLQSVPPHVTHIFFTLSAWESPTIAHFPNPSLKFYEASNRQHDLCSTTFTHARNSQAVIMCYVARDASGSWEIVRSGKLSSGNAKNYEPLILSIQSVISNIP